MRILNVGVVCIFLPLKKIAFYLYYYYDNSQVDKALKVYAISIIISFSYYFFRDPFQGRLVSNILIIKTIFLKDEVDPGFTKSRDIGFNIVKLFCHCFAVIVIGISLFLLNKGWHNE